ncbi:MAG: sugar phosphate isomerase/epimerase [Flavisolibacter sp.]
MYNRRTFLKDTSLVFAGSALIPGSLYAHARKNEIVALQLYSVREDMKRNASGTLEQLAKMGYVYVEHANYVNRKFYGYSAAEFKKLLDGLGLKMPSGHTVMSQQHWDEGKKDFTDAWKYTVEDAASVGQKYVISPWLDESLRNKYDDLIRFMDLFNKSGELCHKSGLRFGYHNHDFEFKYSLNNQKLYDIILTHTDPKLVIQQLDIGNMYGAGGRALELIKKYPGRFVSMHVKDEIKATSKGEMGDGYESTILGKGLLPVKEIVEKARKSGGTSHFVIEQESYQGKTPLDSSKEDLAVMKKWGFLR